jgi:hypothetical protein
LTAASQPLTFHLRHVTGLPHVFNTAAAMPTNAGPDSGQCSHSKSDSHQQGAMSAQFSNVGFAYSRHRQRRSVMFAQLIAAVTLFVSIAVVVTAVSIGIAHACAPAMI